MQYAAHLALHGHNPYKANLLPALTQFRVPIQYATYKLDGSIASTLAYPSLSFLLIIPFLSITNGVQTIILLNVVFLAIEMVILFLVMPRRLRSLAPLIVLGLPFLFDYTVGGDIVTFSLPFLLIVAYRWTETGRTGRLGPSGTAKAVCLGLAASISQFAWFVAPFAAIGVWRMRQPELGNRGASKVVARYVGIAIGTALLLNAPYIVLSPTAWVHGVLTPLFQHAIPFGQGLIDAPAFFHIGGGNLSYYTDAAAVIFAVPGDCILPVFSPALACYLHSPVDCLLLFHAFIVRILHHDGCYVGGLGRRTRRSSASRRSTTWAPEVTHRPQACFAIAWFGERLSWVWRLWEAWYLSPWPLQLRLRLESRSDLSRPMASFDRSGGWRSMSRTAPTTR